MRKRDKKQGQTFPKTATERQTFLQLNTHRHRDNETYRYIGKGTDRQTDKD